MNQKMQRMFSELDMQLSPSDKQWIEETTDEDFVDFHFGLGLFIRNRFIYTSEDNIGKELHSIFRNADNVSALLSKLYWWHRLKISPTEEMLESALKQHLIVRSEADKVAVMKVLRGEP